MRSCRVLSLDLHKAQCELPVLPCSPYAPVTAEAASPLKLQQEPLDQELFAPGQLKNLNTVQHDIEPATFSTASWSQRMNWPFLLQSAISIQGSTRNQESDLKKV